jgi:acyl-CoA synthetase (AMP-forming)/AMP-acid ligase II
MGIEFLCEIFRQHAGDEAVIWKDRPYSYGWLLEQLDVWRARLQRDEIEPGTVVMLEADFSPNAVAMFLALAERRCILVPLTEAAQARQDEFIEIAEGEVAVRIDADDQVAVRRFDRQSRHPIYGQLRELAHPGLVLFSSGSTGKSKAAVHDLVPLLDKFRTPRKKLRSISFLLYDHIGGINTMLYTLANAGCLITVERRSPDAVLKAIETHRVELLPTSPTFVNLILLSEACQRHDLSSLTTVTYGTEPMPESTLKRFCEAVPHVRLQQTYGLSEVGIMRSKSKSSDSLWVKIGGEGFETRVVDGLLEIKARSAMLGYLNAPSPFSEDGWFKTGDAVEQDGEYLRILGRKSEMINVGGEKVFPAEVESVIQQLDNVADVTVHGQKNPITGQIVCARVTLMEPEDPRVFNRRLKVFCRERLAPYKVPVKTTIVENTQHSSRFKRMRRVG